MWNGKVLDKSVFLGGPQKITFENKGQQNSYFDTVCLCCVQLLPAGFIFFLYFCNEIDLPNNHTTFLVFFILFLSRSIYCGVVEGMMGLTKLQPCFFCVVTKKKK